ENPQKLQELIALWWAEAGRFGALPLGTRDAVEILTTERPHLSKPRERYVYHPRGAEVPGAVAPSLPNRSYPVAGEAAAETEEAGGVLFAQGARFGGHALYIKDGKLKYVYSFVGLEEQTLAGQGLNVGKEGGEAVTDDYPGDATWAFVGGTIHKAVVDVSGE